MGDIPNYLEPTSNETTLPDPSEDKYFHQGMTSENLLEVLLKENNPSVCSDYFNNLPLHVIDPIYILGDEKDFRKDFNESLKEAKTAFGKDASFERCLLEEQKSGKGLSKDSYEILARIYVSMRNKGYPKYTSEKGKSSLT